MATNASHSQTILITGCSSGFGELTAKTLARGGHHVFASMRGATSTNARSADALRDWSASEGVRVDIVELDVTRSESVDAAVGTVLDSAGHLDVVVNNAGRGAIGPFEAFSLRQIEDLFSLNVFGPIRVAKAVLPSMRRRGSGLIIHVSSTIGRLLPGVGGLYPTTKWALEGFAESLSYEVKAFGVDAVVVEPGAFPSPALSKALLPDDLEMVAAYASAAARVDAPSAQATPAGYRLPDPQEVADAIKGLVDLPAGQRPLRTVVGAIFTEGVAEFNDAYARASQRLADALRRPDQAITWGRGGVSEPRT